jgi:hypothetical protein
MDPNAILQEMERLVTSIRTLQRKVRELHELSLTLGGWLALGGFEPDWAACPKATAYFRRRPIATLASSPKIKPK